jgi:UDP-N-acetylmuramate dehydrogenase
VRILYSAFLDSAKKFCPELKILTNEALSRHTSFRIGGPAAVMVFPSSAEELSFCLRQLSQMGQKPVILGAGTNVLAPDEGLSRVILCLKDRFSKIHRVDACTLQAQAGASLAALAVVAQNAGLTGLEFAHGIPGTVGGGVYMNAGAYGGEMKQVVYTVTVMDYDGTVRTISAEEAAFGYRTSAFETMDAVIIGATFALQPGAPAAIRHTMTELMEKRRASQPLELPSAGSTFKRPVGGYAAALIDEAGLKGMCVGGAAVSQKHAGFIVNLGGATAADVHGLISNVQQTVEEKSGILLQPEVRIW